MTAHIDKSRTPAKEEAISIEQYNRELEEADAAIDRGEFYTHEEMLEHMQNIIDSMKKTQTR